MVGQSAARFSYTNPRRAATPAKLRRVQDVDEAVSDSEGPLGKAMTGTEPIVQGAERAINSVARKLDPYLSVEYTVNELINAARDPANLARIFYGRTSLAIIGPCVLIFLQVGVHNANAYEHLINRVFVSRKILFLY